MKKNPSKSNTDVYNSITIEAGNPDVMDTICGAGNIKLTEVANRANDVYGVRVTRLGDTQIVIQGSPEGVEQAMWWLKPKL